MKPISEILDGIRDSINEAVTAFHNFMSAHGPRNSDYRTEQEGIIGYFLDRAFLELRLFLEANDIPQLLQRLTADHLEAKGDFMKAEMDPWGEPHSFWARHLAQYVRAVDTTFGTAASTTVTKDLVDILRATVYSITDVECFSSPPAEESEVHVRIEAVLRCVFPNLRHKPSIGKPIKNFEPDTGLPSIQTLIEYKFVATRVDVKRVADEVLADTRGYVSKEWDKFVYVIYETKRLKSETQWKELLSASGVADNTQIIVISGEEPVGRKPIRTKTTRKARQLRKSRTRQKHPA